MYRHSHTHTPTHTTPTHTHTHTHTQNAFSQIYVLDISLSNKPEQSDLRLSYDNKTGVNHKGHRLEFIHARARTQTHSLSRSNSYKFTLRK